MWSYRLVTQAQLKWREKGVAGVYLLGPELSFQQKDIIYARSLKAVWCSGKDLYGPALALAGAETVIG